MLDIKVIREKPEWVKERLAVRCKNYDAAVDEIIAIDGERRAIIADTDKLKQRQNAASREIPRIKQEGGDVKALMAEMKEISEKVKEDEVVLYKDVAGTVSVARVKEMVEVNADDPTLTTMLVDIDNEGVLSNARQWRERIAGIRLS